MPTGVGAPALPVGHPRCIPASHKCCHSAQGAGACCPPAAAARQAEKAPLCFITAAEASPTAVARALKNCTPSGDTTGIAEAVGQISACSIACRQARMAKAATATALTCQVGLFQHGSQQVQVRCGGEAALVQRVLQPRLQVAAWHLQCCGGPPHDHSIPSCKHPAQPPHASQVIHSSHLSCLPHGLQVNEHPGSFTDAHHILPPAASERHWLWIGGRKLTAPTATKQHGQGPRPGSRGSRLHTPHIPMHQAAAVQDRQAIQDAGSHCDELLLGAGCRLVAKSGVDGDSVSGLIVIWHGHRPDEAGMCLQSRPARINRAKLWVNIKGTGEGRQEAHQVRQALIVTLMPSHLYARSRYSHFVNPAGT